MEKTIVPSETHSLKRKVMELMADNQDLKITVQQLSNQNVAMVTGLHRIKRALLEIVNLSPNAIKEFGMLCQTKEDVLHNGTIHQEIDLFLSQSRMFMKYLLFSDEAGKREIERIKKKDKP